MNFLGNIRAAKDFFVRAFSDTERFGTFASILDSAGVKVKLDDPYTQHGWAHGAISVMARMLAAVPFRIVQPDAAFQEALRSMKPSAAVRELALRRRMPGVFPASHRAQTVPVEFVENSAWCPLFERPNAGQGAAAFFAAASIHYLDDGGVLIVALGEVDGVISEGPLGMPDELHVVPWRPGNFELSTDRKTWTVTINGKRIKVPDRQVIPIKLYDPKRPDPRLVGLAPLSTTKSELRQDLAAGAYNEAFFENGAEVGTVVFRKEPLKPVDAAAMERTFDDRHRGVGKSHRPLIISGADKVERNPISHRDMDFIKGRKWNRDTELAALAIHKAILGDTETLNQAIITEARKMAWANALLPMAAAIEDQLKARLFMEFGTEQVWGIFDVSGVEELQDDLLGKAKIITELTNAGVPLNDAKEVAGVPLPDYEWGNLPPSALFGMELGGFGGAETDEGGEGEGAGQASARASDGD